MEMGRIAVLVLSAVTAMVSITSVKVNAENDGIVFSAETINQVAMTDNHPSLHERFVMNNTGVITDKHSGLEWVVGPRKDTTWGEAKTWVEGLAVDGDGWRMPTRDELKSLYQQGIRSNNMSRVFRTYCRFVWAAEMVDAVHAWGFCFAIGEEFWPRCSYSQGARAFAVRSQSTE